MKNIGQIEHGGHFRRELSPSFVIARGMVKRGIKKAMRYLGYEVRRRDFGYEIRKCDAFNHEDRVRVLRDPPRPVDPIWPLPRCSNSSMTDIREEFANYDLWHYPYEFEGGLSFRACHNDPGRLTDDTEKHLQRFRHFMPYLIEAEGGSLEGKRVLDIACNSGFWSIQCALLGANVVGFDARPEMIEQANLLKAIVDVDNVEFKCLDFWDMNPRSLGGTFDIVLNLGVLYHLPHPLRVLQLTKSMAQSTILLDTGVYPTPDPVIELHWEKPFDIRAASTSGVVARPSKSSIELMLRHIRVAESFEIPIRSTDVPLPYLEGKRASWLIKV